jgi:hypothetical protein
MKYKFIVVMAGIMLVITTAVAGKTGAAFAIPPRL